MRHLKLSSIAAAVVLYAAAASAQSLDDLNLQIHGYATQAFVYSTKNNWNTTASSDGSAAWTEAVVNLTAQPEPRLRIGVQARYFLLGSLGNAIALDWAQLDYKVDERFGIRAGKVKTMAGLLNESQDVDPAQLWVLLPQSIYAVGSRNSILAHYGGMVYGSFALGESFGRLDYRAFGGERIVDPEDQDLAPYQNSGLLTPNGLTGPTFGGTLRWHTPLPGLLVGAAEGSERLSGTVNAFGTTGTVTTTPFNAPYFFAQYEHGKWMAAGEYSRIPPHGTIVLAAPQIPTIYVGNDRRSFYVMSSYKLARRLTGGVYYSSATDLKVPVSSARFQKDWALAMRYDFDSGLYLKAEQHIVDGTQIGFNATDNVSLSPNSRMTLLKLGLSF